MKSDSTTPFTSSLFNPTSTPTNASKAQKEKGETIHVNKPRKKEKIKSRKALS